MGNGPRGLPHPNCMCPPAVEKGTEGGSQEQNCVTRACGETGPQAGEVQSHRARAELEEGGVPTRVLNRVWPAAGARTSAPGTQPWGLRLCWSRPPPQTRVSPPLQGLQIAEAGTTAHCPPVPPASPGATPSCHEGHSEDVSLQARHAGAGQRGWPQPQGSLCLGLRDGSLAGTLRGQPASFLQLSVPAAASPTPFRGRPLMECQSPSQGCLRSSLRPHLGHSQSWVLV